ncbi:MAG: hypothetical protein IPG96_19730 [Proteobacteria bacterium]|nr:hypothetical protein [Pseudomonadota bacterium]
MHVLAARSGSRRAAQLLLATLTLAVTPPVVAQHGSATAGDALARGRALFDQAEGHYAAGRYAEAVKLYLRVHALTNHPDMLFNAANAYERMGEFKLAATYLRRYVASPGAEDVTVCMERIGRLEATHEQRQREVRSLRAFSRQDARAERAARASKRSGLLSYLLLGVGAGVVGGSVVTGVLSKRAGDDAAANCAEGGVCLADAKADLDRERRLALVSDVLLGVGVAAVGTGVVLLIIKASRAEGAEAPQRRAARWQIDASPMGGRGAALGLRGTF